MQDDCEKTLLRRYKAAEKEIPNFIEKGLSSKFADEVLLFVYYAGHGCMETKQYFVLNEDELNKRFWSAEDKFEKIGIKSGSAVKIIVVNDCCREDYRKLRESMETEGERSKRLKKEED